MTDAKKQKAAVFHDVDFNRLYADVIRQNDWKKLSASLNDKYLTVKDGGITYRAINHWMSEGLIEDDRDDAPAGWRKLCLKDVIWLHIVGDLRKFGLPLEKIRTTYQSIFTRGKKYNSRDFELAVLLCAATPPMNFFIVVFEDGDARIATLQSLWHNEAVNGYSSPYIRISLNALVCEALGSDRYMPENVHPIVLSGEEIDLVGSYRERNFDEMHVIVKNGELDRIDTSRAVRGATRINDLLAEMRFGEVTVKIADGKIISTQYLKKEKR